MRNVAIFLLLSMVGCAPIYTAPTVFTSTPQNEITVVATFDETWTALKDHAASIFFAIVRFEKDSGLMILNFGSDNPERFIDCGRLKTTNLTNFNGPAIRAIEIEAQATTFTAWMDVVVRKETEQSTSIHINANYVYQAPGQYYNPIWSFDSNGSSTQQVGQVMVTCRPTNVAEREMLHGVVARLSGKPS